VWQPDEKKPFYEISDKGRDYLENPREEIEGEEQSKAQRQSAGNIARNGAERTEDIILTQADLSRDIGNRLRVGIGRYR